MEEERRKYRTTWHHPAITVALFLGMIAICLLVMIENEWSASAVVSLSLAFCAWCVFAAMEMLRPHVVIAKEGLSIKKSGWWRRTRLFPWDDIIEIRGKWEKEMEVVAKDGTSMRHGASDFGWAGA